MFVLPDELQREVMSYLRTCDICGKSASANKCNYCDFNCFYNCKQKQLKNCLISICLMVLMLNISTVYGLLFMMPVLITIESLF